MEPLLIRLTPNFIKKLIRKPYGIPLIFFATGAGVELFMNYFHIGEANIYNSIRKNLSTSLAQDQFKAEREYYEANIINDREQEEESPDRSSKSK